jgi:hypothetical protein
MALIFETKDPCFRLFSLGHRGAAGRRRRIYAGEKHPLQRSCRFQEGAYQSIEQLAEANSLHPKVVRQGLRLAFLSPEVTSTILEGRQPKELALAQIPKLLPLTWAQHQHLLGCV